MTNELRKKNALGTAIPFPEGVQVIGRAVKVYDFVQKLFAR